MQYRRKIILILVVVFSVFAVMYLVTQKQPKPQSTKETVNDVITIIQELDKNPDGKK